MTTGRSLLWSLGITIAYVMLLVFAKEDPQMYNGAVGGGAMFLCVFVATRFLVL